ncbi:MAG: hypothetical protein ACXVLQ_00850 [Bacteriovorax sp.]
MKVLLTFAFLLLSSFDLLAVEAVHGMVLFGKDNLYAYHLPMFHQIHNKQVVLTFDVQDEIKQKILKLEDSDYLTFVPAPFDLDKFIAEPFDLKGDLYSGHFEKGGTIVLEGITLARPVIVYQSQLASPNKGPEIYSLFGTKNDAYAIHLINGGSAIDQIAKLKAIGGSDIDWAIKTGSLWSKSLIQVDQDFSISTPPGRCPSRLCGMPGDLLAKFKVDSIYFEDSVM